MFELLASTQYGRRGRLHTAHGVLESPFFMPVGTLGAMKGISMSELEALGATILLANTYHLHIQPGEDIVEEAGGLHSFVGWERPILTDSGGFQVFSLRGISDITDAGVDFRSHLNGDPLFLSPEHAMRIQHALGADIIMCFDQCPPSTSSHAVVSEAVDRTIRWAKDCKTWHERFSIEQGSDNPKQLLFGIVQGGLERDLREKCVDELRAIGFDGYAIGGLAVGESEEEMLAMVGHVCPLLPENRPRYLMGVGRLGQLREAVRLGVDMFDCVSPMREARHGTIYLSSGERLRMLTSPFRHDHSIIDSDSPSPLSRLHRKSYLCHLLRSGERYGETIACMQNLGVTLKMMRGLRETMNQ